MTSPTPIVEVDDPRLDDYRTLTDPELRKRFEAQRGVFIVESPLAVEALAASPHVRATRSLLVGERRIERMAPVIDDLAALGVPVFTAPAEVLRATAGFDLHRGVVAAVDRPDPIEPDTLIAASRRMLVLEGINDHENLGALFRIAAAFGTDGVLLDPTCADPWYRRSVRVSMGHVLRVPHARAGEWPEILERMAAAGAVDARGRWDVVALTPRARSLLHDRLPAASDARVAVVVGAEGPGLSEATDGLPGLDRRRIAMASGVDSLNVATSAGIALSHLVGLHLS